MHSPYRLAHFCWALKDLLVLIYSKLHSKSSDYLYKPFSFGNISNLLSTKLFRSRDDTGYCPRSFWLESEPLYSLLIDVNTIFSSSEGFLIVLFFNVFFYFISIIIFFRCLWSEFWYPCCRTSALSNTCHWRKCDFYCCVGGFAEWMHLTEKNSSTFTLPKVQELKKWEKAPIPIF